MPALCTSRTSDCTTSDIGGRNSGSGCVEVAFQQRQKCSTSVGVAVTVRELHELKAIFHLDTQGDGVGEAGEGFRRVQPLQRGVYHLVQRVNVVKLRRGPPDQRLLGPRPSPAVSSEGRCWFRIQMTGYVCALQQLVVSECSCGS